MDPNCIRCPCPFAGKGGCFLVRDCHIKQQFYPEQVTATDNPNLYHIDKPGLKGAYHLNCIPCHVKKNAPSSCEGCHAMTDAGKQMFRVDVKGKAEGSKHHE